MTYSLHVLDDSTVPLADRLCALWGPSRGPAIVPQPAHPRTVGPLDPPIEANATEWLQIAAAIDTGEVLKLYNIAIGPLVVDPRSLKASRVLTAWGIRQLGPEDLTALAADIRAKLAPPATVAPFVPLPDMRAKCNRCDEEMPADDRGRHVCPQHRLAGTRG